MNTSANKIALVDLLQPYAVQKFCHLNLSSLLWDLEARAVPPPQGYAIKRIAGGLILKFPRLGTTSYKLHLRSYTNIYGLEFFFA